MQCAANSIEHNFEGARINIFALVLICCFLDSVLEDGCTRWSGRASTILCVHPHVWKHGMVFGGIWGVHDQIIGIVARLERCACRVVNPCGLPRHEPRRTVANCDRGTCPVRQRCWWHTLPRSIKRALWSKLGTHSVACLRVGNRLVGGQTVARWRQVNALHIYSI